MKNYNKEFDLKIHINSAGYRGEEINLEKPEGAKRVLVLGDSFTFGQGVEDEQTYPFQLQKILRQQFNTNNIEVINAGYADGFSPDSYYTYVKYRGLALKPDMIVLGLFVFNDIADIAETNWEKIDAGGLPDKLSSCCRVVDGNILRNKSIEFKYSIPILRNSHLFLLIINTLQNRFHLFPKPEMMPTKGDMLLGCSIIPSCNYKFAPEEQKMYKAIKGIKNLADKEKVPFLVILIPVDLQLYESQFTHLYKDTSGETTFIQKKMSANFAENNISYLDLYPIFDKQRDRGYPYLSVDAHFNSLGHRISAESIAKYIMENKLLKR